jgi:hypothetical protein
MLTFILLGLDIRFMMIGRPLVVIIGILIATMTTCSTTACV